MDKPFDEAAQLQRSNRSGTKAADQRGRPHRRRRVLSTHIIERMAVEVDGTGDALVMLHGLGGTSNVWTPQMPVVGARFRVIRFDLPGSGRSPASSTLSISSLADAVMRALRVLGVETAHFAGHSMGTIVCQHLAEREPALVRSLALVGPVHALPDAGRQAMRERAARVRAEGMSEVAEAILKAATSGDTKAANPVGMAFIRELLMRQDPEGYARNCEALAGAEGADLERIRCRALLVTGDEDAVAPPSAVRAMADRLHDARSVVLSRCGHWTTIERAVEVNNAFREFLFGRR
jgi:pimeloyl-ACP methyl ester carboxylesterase